MFRIPSFYEVEMSFDDAAKCIGNRAGGDLLKGMEMMNDLWDRYLDDQNAFYKGETDEMMYGDDDDFYEHWGYECSAYNIVFEGMSKLFAPAA